MAALEAAKRTAVIAFQKRLHAQQSGEQQWPPAAPRHSSPHTSACEGLSESFQQPQDRLSVWGAQSDSPDLTPACGTYLAVGAGAVFSPAALPSAQLQDTCAGYTGATMPWAHDASAYSTVTNASYDTHSQASLAGDAEMLPVHRPFMTSGLENLTAPLTLATNLFAHTAQHSLPPKAALSPAQQPADTEQDKIDRMMEVLLPQLEDSLSARAAHEITGMRLAARMVGDSSADFAKAVVLEVGRMLAVQSREKDGKIMRQRLKQLPEYHDLLARIRAKRPLQHDHATAQHTSMMSYAANNVQHDHTAGHPFGKALPQAGASAGPNMCTSSAWNTGPAMTAARNNGVSHSTTALWDAANADAAAAAAKQTEDSRLMPPPPPRTTGSRRTPPPRTTAACRKPGQPQLSTASTPSTQQLPGAASPGSKAGPARKVIFLLCRKRPAQEQDAGLQNALKRPALSLNRRAKDGRTCVDLSSAPATGPNSIAKSARVCLDLSDAGDAVGFNSSAKNGHVCLDLSDAADGPRQPGMPQIVPHTMGLPQGHTATPAGGGAQRVGVPVKEAGHAAVRTDEALGMQQQLPPHLLNHHGPILFL